jgi:hypothetical protein
MKKFTARHGRGRLWSGRRPVRSRFRAESKLAWTRGLKSADLGPDSNFRRFLNYKMRKFKQEARIYRGFLYWYVPKKGRLITAYPIPDRFLNEVFKSP